MKRILKEIKDTLISYYFWLGFCDGFLIFPAVINIYKKYKRLKHEKK